MLDLEQRKNDIEMSISKESIENPMLTKKQFKFWFDQLKKLDISKSEQRQKLVDLFVNSIIIYDDHIKFFFNYKEHTETITFDELNNCSDLPDSPRPKGLPNGSPYFFYNHHHNVSYGLLRISIAFVGAVKTLDCIVQEMKGL